MTVHGGMGKLCEKIQRYCSVQTARALYLSRKPQVKDVDFVVGDCDTGYWHTFVICGHQSAVPLLEMITGGSVSDNVHQSRATVLSQSLSPQSEHGFGAYRF